MIGEEVDEAYYTDTMSLCLDPELTERNGADTRIVYTPLHGSGNVPVREILKRIGLSNISVVKEQEAPDGSFPTVKAPNRRIPTLLRSPLISPTKRGRTSYSPPTRIPTGWVRRCAGGTAGSRCLQATR